MYPMRTIIVDDERLALKQLKNMLERQGADVEIVGMFSNPVLVAEQAIQLQPDVVFLDIQMPEIDGLRLGEQLKEVAPNIEIVFVTGYDQYALRAFELYALDYIMKPVQQDRLKSTVQRLRDRLEQRRFSALHSLQPAPMICCFNHIRIQRSSEESQVIKWRTSKARELFAYLLHNRNRIVGRDTLMELLWPDIDEPRAAQQMYTSIYHIRQVMKEYQIDMISLNNESFGLGYRLKVEGIRIDTEEWECNVNQLEPVGFHNLEEYEGALRQYEGDYYGEYGYIWAEYERERLRRKLIHLAQNLSKFYEEQWMLREAVNVNLRIQQLLPYEEGSYFTLMKLLDSLGDIGGVEAQYQTLIIKIEQELESEVNKSITSWYERWKGLSSQRSDELSYHC